MIEIIEFLNSETDRGSEKKGDPSIIEKLF